MPTNQMNKNTEYLKCEKCKIMFKIEPYDIEECKRKHCFICSPELKAED